MHMTYKGQLVFKENMVKETLRKIGGIENVKIDPIYGMSSNALYYRNKVQVPVGSVRNKTLCGFYKRETHDIIPLDVYVRRHQSSWQSSRTVHLWDWQQHRRNAPSEGHG